MPYELNAVIGSFDLLRIQTVGLAAAAVAPLRQRMGLVPVTEQFLAELPDPPAGPEYAEPASHPFTVMSPVLEGTLGCWSRGGPIAYVEADFHGGDGHQTAAVWHTGSKVWGPAHSRDFSGPREDWPINAALALLDVVPGKVADPHDLFTQVGLGQEQDMGGWQSLGRGARWAATYDEWEQTQRVERERATRAATEFEKYRRLPDVPVPLDGSEIMELLGTPPGPLIGAATRHLQELHLERGPLSRELAATLLRAWAVDQEPGHRTRTGS
ncbi:hypothetical protein ACFY94_25045 [Streptomyces griseorubiginosus]|uniref:hypothetical protein n=1 Tax=Streptomyces griseorubiginosus TaxID=67304 RepID=UPI0036E524F7